MNMFESRYGGGEKPYAVFTLVTRDESGKVLDVSKTEHYAYPGIQNSQKELEKEGYKQRNGKVVDGIMYITMEKIMKKQRRSKSG